MARDANDFDYLTNNALTGTTGGAYNPYQTPDANENAGNAAYDAWPQVAAQYGLDPTRKPQPGKSGGYVDNPYTTPDANESASKLFWLDGKPHVSIDPTMLQNKWSPADLKGKIVDGPGGEYLMSSADYERFAQSAPKDTSEVGAFLGAVGMMAGPLAQAGAFGAGAQSFVSGLPGSGGTFPAGAESGAWGGVGENALTGSFPQNANPWGVNPRDYGSVLDVPYDVGQNLVNNPDVFNAASPTGGFNMDYFTNTPQSTIVSGLQKLGLSPAAALSAAATLASGASGSSGDGSGGSAGSVIPGIPNNVLGQLLSAGAGYVGSTNLANSLKDISDQARADRAPALSAFNTALSNPDSFYKSAPMAGATDAILRKLSVNGNPAMNPGDLSKAAAYGLDKYNDWLKTLAGPAFGGADTNARLATTAATAAQNPLNALGYGANAILNPQPTVLDLINAMNGKTAATTGGLTTDTQSLAGYGSSPPNAEGITAAGDATDYPVFDYSQL